MTSLTETAVVVGDPKPASRTLHAAVYAARQLAGTAPQTVIDLVTLGAGLPDQSGEHVAAVAHEVAAAQLVVFASPTYKSTFTGLLKLFLDRFAASSLAGVVAVPMMLGADPRHALAPEVFLRPMLAELGATLPTRALYVLEDLFDAPAAYAAMLAAACPQVRAAVRETAAPEEVLPEPVVAGGKRDEFGEEVRIRSQPPAGVPGSAAPAPARSRT